MKFKWNEMNAAEKLEAIVSLVMAVIALIFAILDMSDKWPNGLCYLTLAVLSVFEGIFNWKKKRKLAILEYVAAVVLAIAGILETISLL